MLAHSSTYISHPLVDGWMDVAAGEPKMAWNGGGPFYYCWILLLVEGSLFFALPSEIYYGYEQNGSRAIRHRTNQLKWTMPFVLAIADLDLFIPFLFPNTEQP